MTGKEKLLTDSPFSVVGECRLALSLYIYPSVQTSLEQEQEKLKASSDLDIWCEIVPPFHLLPKSLLEKTCNAVLRTTLKTLLKSFMNELSADYKLWSTDTTYREERAKRSLTKTV